jgi:hypothetical protein
MKIKSVIKKIEKALDVEILPNGPAGYIFYCDGYVGSFRKSHCGDARGFHVRRENDHSDAMVDYFAGSFYDNCTQMIRIIRPPGPKFSPGTLVQGKINKRAARLGIAERIGLITTVSKWGSYEILWADTGNTDSYSYERDLEEV